MRNDVVELARHYKGVRWVHQGRSISGIDCAGLIIVVGNELGLINYQADGYARRTNGTQFSDYFHDAGLIPKQLAHAKPGDIILTKDHAHPSHCGFYTNLNGQPGFIHAFIRRRMVVEDYYSHGVPSWQSKATHCFSFPGVDD